MDVFQSFWKQEQEQKQIKADARHWIIRSATLIRSKSGLDYCPRRPHVLLSGFLALYCHTLSIRVSFGLLHVILISQSVDSTLSPQDCTPCCVCTVTLVGPLSFLRSTMLTSSYRTQTQTAASRWLCMMRTSWKTPSTWRWRSRGRTSAAEWQSFTAL